jgi:hypothetical protein
MGRRGGGGWRGIQDATRVEKEGALRVEKESGAAGEGVTREDDVNGKEAREIISESHLYSCYIFGY